MINPLTLANTFANLVSGISSLIGLANNLTNGPTFTGNTELILSRPGISLNIQTTGIITGTITTGNITSNNITTSNGVTVTNTSVLGNIVSTGVTTVTNTLTAGTLIPTGGNVSLNAVTIVNATINTAQVTNLITTTGILTLSGATISSANIANGTANIQTLSITTGNGTLGTSNLVTNNITLSNISNSTISNSVVVNPIGLTKADVFLGNVDDTSDAQKNSATANLYNKTIISPLIITGTTSDYPNTSLGIANKDYVDHRTEINENILINGAMDIWQRWTTVTANTFNTPNPSQAGYYICDRWNIFLSASANNPQSIICSRSTNTPTVANTALYLNYSIEANVRNVFTVTADNVEQSAYIAQGIEGYDWRQAAQRPLTLSFWVQSPKTGQHAVCLSTGLQVSVQNSRKYIAEYTINTPNTWEYKTLNFPPSPQSGDWNYINGSGAVLIFSLTKGTTYTNTLPGIWVANNAICTANQVNVIDGIGNIFRITAVKLETGNTATHFLPRPFAEELRYCQRTFCKSYNYDQRIFLYTTTPIGLGAGQFAMNCRVNGNSASFFSDWVQFPVTMKQFPQCTMHNPLSYSGQPDATYPYDVTASKVCQGGGVNYSGSLGMNATITANSGSSINNLLVFNWTASASEFI